MTPCIEYDQVCKSFGSTQILHQLDLQVPRGIVFAFLGNNGAGKSTAIRLMLGLMTPDAGQIRLLGLDVAQHRAQLMRKVGALVDAPSAYENLTAHEFLRIAVVLKGLPRNDITRVLQLVDLTDTGQTLIANFSLGMKQRLALAFALLGEPQLLVLDEPTNGLDPSGIQDIRALLRRLPAATGATVFLSSHQLDEVEKVASHIALLRDGRVQLQCALADFKLHCSRGLILRCDAPQQARQLLEQQGYTVQQDAQQQLYLPAINDATAWHINALLVQAGVKLYEARQQQQSLEHWFADQMQHQGKN